MGISFVRGPVGEPGGRNVCHSAMTVGLLLVGATDSSTNTHRLQMLSFLSSIQ